MGEGASATGSNSPVKASTANRNFLPQASPNIVIALAGNKADLAASRAVDYEEAKQYADENGLLFMETSAKTAVNVNEIFLAIGERATDAGSDGDSTFNFFFFFFSEKTSEERRCGPAAEHSTNRR